MRETRRKRAYYGFGNGSSFKTNSFNEFQNQKIKNWTLEEKGSN